MNELLKTLACLALIVQVGFLYSQSESVRRVTSTTALTNATVIIAPGDTMPNSTVVVENGLIRSVGSRVPIPSYARQIACDSLFIYAGFIEGLSYTGVSVPDKQATADSGNSEEKEKLTSSELAGITPGRSAIDYLKNDGKNLDKKRRLGFTTSHIVPKGGMLPGMGAIVLLGNDEPDRLMLAKDVSLLLEFKPSRNAYPRTLIGVIAKFRELYTQAGLLNDHKARYSEGESGGVVRPRVDIIVCFAGARALSM